VARTADRKSLENLAAVVRELELVSGHSLEEFREGLYVRRAAERLVQLGVDLACELGVGVLLGSGRARRLDGYEEVFMELGSAGFIPGQLAQKMVGAAALRRRLVFASVNGAEHELHQRLPFLTVLLREYGRHVETLLKSPHSKSHAAR
jgi:uncharacterized protein YutE (UPF0331/DUF86 family)